MQVIGHGAKAGRDNAARKISGPINDLEGEGSAKIQRDSGRSEVMSHRDGVGETIAPDGSRLRLIEAKSPHGSGCEL